MGALPTPATKLKYMREDNKEGKTMTATEAKTIRELVDLANDFRMSKEDIVSILPSREGYIMIYYY